MSAYFQLFPYTDYTLQGQSGVVIKDIFRRSKFFEAVKTAFGLYRTYSILEGERPENVATKFYGNPDLYWVVMLYNEYHDPFFEWPMSEIDLERYCRRVYGVPTMFQTRHFERDGLIIGDIKYFDKDDPDYVWVPPANPGPNDPSVYPVSHFEYEQRLNDERREIKILREDVVPNILKEFEGSIKNG